MKFEGTKVFGIENAIIGMRLPMTKNYEEARKKSDSDFILAYEKPNDYADEIGADDMRVAQNRCKADSAFCGQPESKFLRFITVQVAITAPMFWWAEMDTYKVGTVANSTSKMHKLASIPITMDCFEMNDFKDDIDVDEEHTVNCVWSNLITDLEQLRQFYHEEKNIETKKEIWKELLRLLPNSWLQTRMWQCNYEVLRNIYSQRKHHKLKEWSVDFVEWIRTLPYSKELITDGE